MSHCSVVLCLGQKSNSNPSLSVSYISIVPVPLQHSSAFQTDFLTQYCCSGEGWTFNTIRLWKYLWSFCRLVLKTFQTNVAVVKSHVTRQISPHTQTLARPRPEILGKNLLEFLDPFPHLIVQDDMISVMQSTNIKLTSFSVRAMRAFKPS